MPHDHHHHGTQHGHGPGHGPHHDAELAELLDLDAELLRPLLDDVMSWVGEQASDAPRRVVDLGAGTGVGSLALARRFPTAEVIAVDRSASMLDRVRTSASGDGLADRLRLVPCDLDGAWPPIGTVDLAWASSSLHEVTDADRVLRDVHAALAPAGLVVVVEMDALPRFLPDDVGLGRPGLERRCHEALARAGWNRHPDWRPHLERAGFAVVGQRTFTVDAHPAPPGTGRYAGAFLRRMRFALDGQVDAEDLGTLDCLLADDGPLALANRRDLTLRAGRTAWAARRADPTRSAADDMH